MRVKGSLEKRRAEMRRAFDMLVCGVWSALFIWALFMDATYWRYVLFVTFIPVYKPEVISEEKKARKQKAFCACLTLSQEEAKLYLSDAVAFVSELFRLLFHPAGSMRE